MIISVVKGGTWDRNCVTIHVIGEPGNYIPRKGVGKSEQIFHLRCKIESDKNYEYDNTI